MRILCCDFSSTLNTIQPVLQGEKHREIDTWIIDYSSRSPRYVRLHELCLHGAGEVGTVLSTFLFTLYTSDFKYNSESVHLQRLLCDSVIMGCISGKQEGEYRDLVCAFVEWHESSHLACKTKELVIDFGKKKTCFNQGYECGSAWWYT